MGYLIFGLTLQNIEQPVYIRRYNWLFLDLFGPAFLPHPKHGFLRQS